MYDPGENIHPTTHGLPHLVAYNLADPEQETATQRTGRLYRTGGLTLLIGALVFALVAALLAEGQIFTRPAAQILAALAAFALITIGSVYLSAGIVERRTQDHRALLRHMLAAEVDRATEHAAQHQQLDEMQEHVEAELAEIREAITVIAAQIPEALERAHWHGFNAAVREGFLAKTGTDRPYPPKLGLVPSQTRQQPKP